MAAPILNVAFPAPGSVSRGEQFLPRGVGVPPANGQSFASLVREVTQQGIEAGNATELEGTKSLNKSTDIVDVVTAVTNAEVTLETAVAIRDRIISAYQTIIRMPI